MASSAPSSLIGICGATGQLGSRIITQLKAKGYPAQSIIAFARSPAKAEAFGTQVRQADYEQPKELAQAFQGVEKLLVIASNKPAGRDVQHANVFQAAKSAGVKFIAYTSIMRCETSPVNVAEEHRHSEAALKATGIPHALLRNGRYTENYTMGVSGNIAAGMLAGCSGDGKINGADREDYAAAAVVVLTEPNQEGQIYELAGDSGFTKAELAAEMSRNSGKEVAHREMSEADYRALLEKFGLPGYLVEWMSKWDTQAKEGIFADDGGKQLSKLIGRPTTPMAVTLARAYEQSKNAPAWKPTR